MERMPKRGLPSVQAAFKPLIRPSDGDLMKFFIALSANMLITAIVVFLCYAAATAPTSTYLVAGLVVCFLSACYLSRKIFAKPL